MWVPYFIFVYFHFISVFNFSPFSIRLSNWRGFWFFFWYRQVYKENNNRFIYHTRIRIKEMDFCFWLIKDCFELLESLFVRSADVFAFKITVCFRTCIVVQVKMFLSLFPETCGLSRNPCRHGGTCLPGTKPKQFDCQCQVPYTGRYCEIGKHNKNFFLNTYI